MALTVWGYAKLNHTGACCAPLFDGIALAAAPRLHEFDSQVIRSGHTHTHTPTENNTPQIGD